MSNLVKKSVFNVMTALAKKRVKRLGLFTIGVTGSVGKTSTKECIYHVLKSKFRVLRSANGYNTEIGLPLTILEQKTGFSSAAKWGKILLSSFWKAYFSECNMQILLIEMGVDKPGDMDELLRIVSPQVGVMTTIKPVHLAEGQFKDLEDIFMEKSKLPKHLPEKGTAVLNADDPYIMTLKDKLKCKAIFYGAAEWADLRVVKLKNDFHGISFSLAYRGEVVDGFAPILGAFQIYVVMAAVATALTQGFTLSEAVKTLADFRLPAGRMNPIDGIKETLIIDSSYNASPEAVKQALDILAQGTTRRIAVLGSMNELGSSSEEKHREIGKYLVGKVDLLFTVGDNAKFIAQEAVANGLKEQLVQEFDSAEVASDAVSRILQKGDVVLVKGSQNKVRLERLVKALMKNPENAKNLLVRQDDEWNKIN